MSSPAFSPVQSIADLVRHRVAREGVDLSADPDVAARYAREAVRGYSERSLAGEGVPLADDRAAEGLVLAELTGYGQLQPHLDDPDVEEIWINGPSHVVTI